MAARGEQRQRLRFGVACSRTGRSWDRQRDGSWWVCAVQQTDVVDLPDWDAHGDDA